MSESVSQSPQTSDLFGGPAMTSAAWGEQPVTETKGKVFPKSGYGQGMLRRNPIATDEGSLQRRHSRISHTPVDSSGSLSTGAAVAPSAEVETPTSYTKRSSFSFNPRNPYDMEVFDEHRSGYFNNQEKKDPVKVTIYGSGYASPTRSTSSRSGLFSRKIMKPKNSAQINETEPLIQRLDTMHLDLEMKAALKASGIDDDDITDLWGSVLNVLKSTLGIAVLSVSWTFAQMGLIPGLCCYLLSLLTSLCAWIVIAECSRRKKKFLFGQLVRSVFGEKIGCLCDSTLLCMLGLVCVCYCVFLCDFIVGFLHFFGVGSDNDDDLSHQLGLPGIPGLTDDQILLSRINFLGSRFFMELCFVFGVLIPVSFKTELSRLAFTSLLGLLCVGYMFVLIIGDWIIRFVETGQPISHSVSPIEFNPVRTTLSGKVDDDSKNANGGWFLAWLQAFAALFAIFCSHFNVPKYYGCLRDRSMKKWYKLTAISYSVMFVVSITMGLLGYFACGKSVNQSITMSLPQSSYAVGLCQIAMFGSIISTYPLVFMAFKDSLFNLFFKFHISKCNLYGSSSWNRFWANESVRHSTHVCFQLIFFIASVHITEGGALNAFLMSSMAMPLQFVVPGFMFLRLTQESKSSAFSTRSSNNFQTRTEWMWGWFLIIFGGLASLGSLTACVFSWF